MVNEWEEMEAAGIVTGKIGGVDILDWGFKSF